MGLRVACQYCESQRWREGGRDGKRERSGRESERQREKGRKNTDLDRV